MAEEAGSETTLRDTISQAYEEHVPTSPPADPASPSTVEAQPPAEPATATPERARDEKTGQFVPKKEEKRAAPVKEPLAAAPAAPAPAKSRPARPSSWSKEYWDHWEKLDPSVAEYIHKREGDYAKGVSTYKAEYDNLKPLSEVLAPHQESIKQLGVTPAQFVNNLATAHHNLARGTDEQKLAMFMKLAQDYRVNVQSLFIRGQDGQVYFNPQVQAYQPPAQPQPSPQKDVAALVREQMAAVMGEQEIKRFADETDASGNKVHQHFDAVREDMALLLDAGKAQDLKDAYAKAIRLHDDIFQSEQEAKRKADEAARQEAARKAVATAKASNVSPKTATPSSAAGGAKPKGLRATLEAAFDEHTASRV